MLTGMWRAWIIHPLPAGMSMGWLSGKKSACNAEDSGDAGLIPGSGRSSGGGHGNPLQDSCLENPMDRGAWQAIVYSIAKSQTQLSASGMYNDRSILEEYADSYKTKHALYHTTMDYY